MKTCSDTQGNLRKGFSEPSNSKAAGGGKSFALLFESLKYVDCPDYYAVYFRKTVKQLERTLWKEAKKMYSPFLYEKTGNRKGKFKGLANIKEKDKIIRFPSGATIEFSYLDNDKDCETNWQGAELTSVFFDEFTHFSEYCFNYIRTRMRSSSKYKSFIRCSLNPHPTHFVHKYLARFIDQKTGFAIKEYSGRMAWLVFDKGGMHTAWTKEELIEKFPNKNPRNYTFIPSRLDDNKKMLEMNESYRDDLEANDPANAAMLLHGNWKYTPAANGVWERSTVKGQIVDHIPLGCSMIRVWDKAGAKPVKEGGDSKTLDPDYTCSVGMAKDQDGLVYVFGNYAETSDGSQRARFREKPGVRDAYILSQCKLDGSDVIQVLPQDPGQGGIFEFKESAKVLQSAGFTVKKDPSISNASKMKRFDPFAAACFNGLVYWVRASFSVEVWDYMMLELENFNPLTKNNGFHDDLVDCFSSGWAASMSNKIYRAVHLPSIAAGNTTLLSAHRKRIR